MYLSSTGAIGNTNGTWSITAGGVATFTNVYITNDTNVNTRMAWGNFSVDTGGNLTATNANFTGAIKSGSTITGGTITGGTITGTDLDGVKITGASITAYTGQLGIVGCTDAGLLVGTSLGSTSIGIDGTITTKGYTGITQTIAGVVVGIKFEGGTLMKRTISMKFGGGLYYGWEDHGWTQV